MESEPKINANDEVQDTSFFSEQLRRGRKENNIYLVARALPFLMSEGIDVAPTEQEKEQMLQKLGDARNNETEEFFKGVEGYMLARWLMLVNHFWPGSEPATEDDISAIKKAFEGYKKDENFHQMASLIQTGKEIGIIIDTSTLQENEMAEIERVLAELK